MHLEHLAPLLPIFLLLVLTPIIRVLLLGRAADKVSYERAYRLFSPAERSFLGVLDQTFGDQYRVVGKVRIADIIRPRRGLSVSARTAAFNRIVSKHVDFALCDPRTLQVVGVIELDDSSHDHPDRQHRDKVVDAALSSAGVPFVRIPAQPTYTPAEIRVRMSVLFDRA